MFNQENMDCNDLSAIALFQSVIYGNNSLMYKEKKSFGSVISTPSPMSDSIITPKSCSQTPTNMPISLAALNSTQCSIDKMNGCKHNRVTKSWNKDTDSNIKHYIECDTCGRELYHYAEKIKNENLNKNDHKNKKKK
eukprot:937815_1